ncbi:MAG: diguanylate cyclase, partial [Chitinispirillia bacterium]|nr:diguanylate cyclase [Chitinispirillia bacterium]
SVVECTGAGSPAGIVTFERFMGIASGQAARLAETGGISFVILFEIDHFIKITGEYGAAAASEAVRAVAERVVGAARPQDVLARHSGERFVLFAPDINEGGVTEYAGRLRHAVSAAPVRLGGTADVAVTACFGIASLMPENDVDAAIQYAGGALEVAQRGGRNKNKIVVQMSRH